MDKISEFNFNQVSFRPRFWVIFYGIFALNLFFGILLVPVGIYSLAGGADLLPRGIWAFLALFGISFLFSAFFAGYLLVSLAQLLRYTRNQEIRAKSIIGSRDINEYSTSERERNESILKTIDERYQEIGKILSKRIDEQKTANSQYLSSISEQITRIISQVEDSNKETKKSIAESMNTLRDSAAGYIQQARLAAAEKERIRAEEERRAAGFGKKEALDPDAEKPKAAAVDPAAVKPSPIENAEDEDDKRTEEDAGDLEDPEENANRFVEEASRKAGGFFDGTITDAVNYDADENR